MRIVHKWVSSVHKECALIKLIGLLLTTMASRNGIYSALVYAEKGKIWGLDIASQNVP